MEGQGSQCSGSAGPQSVSQQRNPGAPSNYVLGEDPRLLLTLVFFRRKIKAPTQLLHALMSSALQQARDERHSMPRKAAMLPGHRQFVRPKTDQLPRSKIINVTAVNWAALFVPQPVTMRDKRNMFSFLCSTAHLTPGTAGNSCREELSGKRKAEQRAVRTHKMRQGEKTHTTGETKQLKVPSGFSWPCLGFTITSKAGSDPAAIKVSSKTPSHMSSSGLNS